MKFLARLLAALPLLLLSPLFVLVPFLALIVTDLCWLLFGSRNRPTSQSPDPTVSIVIPNWNGKDLLSKYLPSIIEAASRVSNTEVLVVDNGSDDGSVDFVREHFPGVRVIALPTNLGFGGGSNTGFREAKGGIVVLLNSDMRVDPDFLPPLIAGFTDAGVFAVSCQIFFSDPDKLREETGLTQGWWENGCLRVRHRIDPAIQDLYPCFYGGGGSCAFDRKKFLELGGFDPVFHPFYLEDTDLGYMAWKRGWKVLYQPRSIVFHEHRGTIGKKFPPTFIDSVVKKNLLLFCWKNIHEAPLLVAHFFFAFAESLLGVIFGDSPQRTNLHGLARAFLQTPDAMRSRWQALSYAVVNDTEAFLRPLGGYFRDRFSQLESRPEKLNVLFVSPYPIYPPTHGGGVFMYQTCTELTKRCNLHLIALLEYPHERRAHDGLTASCATAEFILRMKGSKAAVAAATPHAVNEFNNHDLAWLIHRQIYTQQIDILQLEYLVMGQYAGSYHQIPSILFEHDVYFQSISRQLPNMRGAVRRGKASFEYLRALYYELHLLPKMDRIQVCSQDNREYLESFLPAIKGRIDDGLRAGIDTRRYEFQPAGREPYTMLFLGSFRHIPNQEALDWFTRRVLPKVLEAKPEARLVVIGSDPPPRHSLPEMESAIEMIGFVEDVRQPLAQYAVFICPILSGSGVRVKLLEAFAAGIPVVSTRIGAEGLATEDQTICALADAPKEFAQKILNLFDYPEQAEAMATRARAEVEENRDMETITERLVENYRAAVTTARKS
jgi:O-antigen biosynthesis protein